MKPLTDNAGVAIGVGDVVRQRNAFNPNLGALLSNAGQTGIVVGLGRTRVQVDFGRTKRGAFGTIGTDKVVIDLVHATMLTVVPPTNETSQA